MLPLLPLALALSAIGSQPGDSLSAKCSDPKKLAIGALSGHGQVSYRVGPEGRPDAATIRVATVSGISAPAFASAVARILPTCRIKGSRDGLPVAVSQEFQFNNPGFVFSRAAVTPDALDSPDTLVTAPPVDVAPGPYVVSSPALEERPQALRCKLAEPVKVPYTGVDAISTQQHMREGVVRLRFIVAPDGHAPADSVTVVAATNPASTNRAVKTIVDCKFAPGRIGGVPVSVIMFHELVMR